MEFLHEINWTLFIPIIALQFILVLIALIDCARQEQTNGPKWLWVLIIIAVNLLGPILYFIFGRSQN
ncbi:PLDc_N domain-containing protein [Salipaludibacillus agaradhaerens]|uniref:PLDc_N domain-containing protein n=1 Tax=Salipaludibacillus agaradhaerens TaxID=76935 RepID=A0A9Q4AYQ9_SALAG|nr:PLDc_N domain-containing protein [Salipaludibacillus agaradhaerens]MCR6107810.1 PLDc_N domain-containing protein [Salipaludibacillus agaradhaerens]MCR6115155.1 PLDc_N domain-containing protein [Salipaludibacillus agaradhaerens]MCR6119839.1 PLDc_N domain-containing protein [Salipaludibacillus agaradhaerens]UJW59818.1 PLDc_N domain-containing protein [Bacillus sp. A116_S68]